MDKSAKNISSWLIVGLSAIIYIWLVYLVPRENFGIWLTGMCTLTLGYLFLLRSTVSWRWLTWAGFGFRVLLLFSLPSLSDDYFRFIWDGRLLANSINPFLHLPSYYLENPVPGLDEALFQSLNSPEYFTIYPPVNQVIFAVAGWLSPTGGLSAGAVWMKLCILAAEGTTLLLLPKLLAKWNLPAKRVLWYALNPMVIVELTGNIHFEALMICFLLLAIDAFTKEKWWQAALYFSLSVASKLLPLMFLPLLWRRLGTKRSISVYLLTGGFCLLWFLPFFNLEMLKNLSASVGLYFQKFEFNASIYYVVRWIGYLKYGYNVIETAGVRLSWFAIGFIAILSLVNARGFRQIMEKMLLCLSVYFFLATIVHPWYISTLLALAIFTNFRYPMVWGILAFLSYATYRDSSYQQPLGLMGLEYGVTYLWLLWELKLKYGEKWPGWKAGLLSGFAQLYRKYVHK